MESSSKSETSQLENRVGASGSNQVGSHQNEVVFAHVHLSPQPMTTNPGCPVETCSLEHLHALVLCKPPSGIKKSLRAFGYILGAVILSMMIRVSARLLYQKQTY